MRWGSGEEEGIAFADTLENLSADPYLPGRGRTKQEWLLPLPSYVVAARAVRNNILTWHGGCRLHSVAWNFGGVVSFRNDAEVEGEEEARRFCCCCQAETREVTQALLSIGRSIAPNGFGFLVCRCVVPFLGRWAIVWMCTFEHFSLRTKESLPFPLYGSCGCWREGESRLLSNRSE